MNAALPYIKVAIVGSGISGLASAYSLAQSGHSVTLFEANDYFGGHTHTVDVTLDGITHGVDTGFLVFNHQTYPNLVRLFDELDIPTVATDMSFSVKLPLENRMLEWSGSSLNTVFAQRRNLLDKRFIRMLQDILRFNEQATALVEQPDNRLMRLSLGDYLLRHDYSAEFRDWYLLPMAGCIWSCPVAQMLAFPLATFVRFCHNHGLLQITGRPQWHTVDGGARQYVEKMLRAIPDSRLGDPVRAVIRSDAGGTGKVRVVSSTGSELFDHVVLAGHSDQSLQLLKDIPPAEEKLLGAIKYQPNRAVLHTDASCLPQNKSTWSAWNYQSRGASEPQVCVHYLINKLQPLPFKNPVIVSLNPIDEPDPSSVIASYDYAHPVFDKAAIAAQQDLHLIQGRNKTWFAGAWTGYGFHEDGLKSGLAVAQAINTHMAEVRYG
jgi:predicted NAD/FAD-binding protein